MIERLVFRFYICIQKDCGKLLERLSHADGSSALGGIFSGLIDISVKKKDRNAINNHYIVV